MENELSEMQSRFGYLVECEVPEQAQPDVEEEPWEVEKAIELGKTFVIGYSAAKKNFGSFMPVLLKANQELSKSGNPYRSKNGNVVTWGDYCETIGVSKRTANNWLANYRLAIEKTKPRKKKEKQNEGIQAPPKKPVTRIMVTSVTKDDNGNLVIDYACEDCGLEVQLIVDKGSL
jgi:hypothetical protein